MATTAINILKSWFQNGDFPTEDQFWAWMDSYWHKDEKIPMDIIQGLDELLQQKATVEDIYNVNQRIDDLEAQPSSAITVRLQSAVNVDYALDDTHLLEKAVIIPTSDIELAISTTPGGGEISPFQTYPANVPQEVVIGFYADGLTHIYFDGITTDTRLILYKRT